MFNVVLIYLLSFSGVFFGKILKKIADEEVKFGEKYLIRLQYVLLFLIAVFLVYYASFNYFLILSFLIGFGISFLFKKKYFYLGLALSAASFSPESLILIASLIFIYGLSFGSLSKTVLNSFIYFFIALVLVSLIYFFNLPIDNNYLLYFAAGSLFLRY